MLSRSVTQQYPEVRPDLPPRSRGVIGLVEENCTVCMLCARECPDWCIYIDSHKETLPAPEGGRPRARNVLDRFAIDFSLCMYCGICIEVCPFDALFWSPEFEYAEGDIRNLIHEKDKLAAWAQTVPPPPAHEPNADPPKELAAASRPLRPGNGGAGRDVTRPAAGPGGAGRGVTRPVPGAGAADAGPASPASGGSADASSAPAVPDSDAPSAPAVPGSDTSSAPAAGAAAGRTKGGQGGPGAPEPVPDAPSGSTGPAPASSGTAPGSPATPGDTASPGDTMSGERGEVGTTSGESTEGGTARGDVAPGAAAAGGARGVTGRPGGAAEPPSDRRPPRPERRASAGHASVRAIRPPGALPKKDDGSSTGKPSVEKLSTGEGGVPPAAGPPGQTPSTEPSGEPEEEK
ncbi:4Fe-4S binding protein [Streptosporangium sp. NPDC000396]|uniref:4Fe-4S binding protein n=1 Tax=Streptosporangium sp. NPDC000396 TaxID=3366185 RepID=UPI0036740186